MRGHHAAARKITVKVLAAVLVIGSTSFAMVHSPVKARADSVSASDDASRALAVNVPGELLTAAASNTGSLSGSQVAAILANKVKYNWSWSTSPTLSAVSGNSSKVSTQARARYGKSAAVVAATSTFAAPATQLAPPTQLVNGASEGIFGSALAAAAAVAGGIALGSGADRLMGVDVTGGLCAEGPSAIYDGFNAVLSNLTLSNCQGWRTTQAMKTAANMDIASTSLIGTGDESCSSSGCATIYSAVTAYPDREQIYCVAATTGDPLTVNHPTNGAYTHLSNGDYWWLGGPNYEKTPRWGCPSYPGAVAYGGLNVLLNGANSAAKVWRANQDAGVVEGTTVTDTDPDRRFVCEVVYDGGSSVSMESDPFKQSATSFPIPECPAVPTTRVPVSVTIFETSPFGKFDIWSSSVTNAYQDWSRDYPECTNGSCLLDLRKDGVSCFDSPGDCATWLTETDAADDYKCVYGTHERDLASCYLYANIFSPSKLAAGNGYANPANGSDVGVQTTQTEEDKVTQLLMDRGWNTWNPTSAALQLGVGDQGAAARVIARQCITLNLQDECETRPIFAPGNDVQEAALHDLNAIRGVSDSSTNGAPAQPAVLTYTSTPGDRDYLDTFPCVTGSYPSDQNCDEYPFRSSVENRDGRSLKVIDKGDNQREGSYLQHFYSTKTPGAGTSPGCGLKDPDDSGVFVVVPTPDNTSPNGSFQIGLPTSEWCTE